MDATVPLTQGTQQPRSKIWPGAGAEPCGTGPGAYPPATAARISIRSLSATSVSTAARSSSSPFTNSVTKSRTSPLASKTSSPKSGYRASTASMHRPGALHSSAPGSGVGYAPRACFSCTAQRQRVVSIAERSCDEPNSAGPEAAGGLSGVTKLGDSATCGKCSFSNRFGTLARRPGVGEPARCDPTASMLHRATRTVG